MPSRSSRRWQFAGLGALVVLNVVLIALLVLRPAAPAVEERETPVSASVDAPSTPPVKQEPAPLPSPTERFMLEAAPAERILVNADESTAWRAATGTCGSPGTLERSVDRGQSWEELPLELAPVSRLRVLSTQALFAIGGGEDCEPTYVASSTAGSSWATNDEYLVGSWYLVPDEREAVATPVGELSVPCEAVELAAVDAMHAAVLCTDGTLSVTADGGGSWTETDAPLDALAIGVAEEGYVLAGAGEACEDGVALRPINFMGDALDDERCVAAQPDRPAELAVSANGGATWLWVGEDVLVSTDGGRSW